MILVFGGEGQLGRGLTQQAALERAQLVALGRNAADVTKPAAVSAALSTYRPSIVVNAAAFTNVDAAETEAAAAAAVNAHGADILARMCAVSEIPLLHISTDYVFDGQNAEPYREDDACAPLNVYGRTKLAGEAAVRASSDHHLILRTSWVYGEFGRNFLKTMVRLCGERSELRVVDDQHGSPTSTRQLAVAIIKIASRLVSDPEVSGTYHYTGSGATTWYRFAATIVAAQEPLTGRAPTVTPITTAQFPTAAKRPANSMLDCGAFRRVFGFSADSWTEEAIAMTQKVVLAEQGHVTHAA